MIPRLLARAAVLPIWLLDRALGPVVDRQRCAWPNTVKGDDEP